MTEATTFADMMAAATMVQRRDASDASIEQHTPRWCEEPDVRKTRGPRGKFGAGWQRDNDMLPCLAVTRSGVLPASSPTQL